jgi:hypothetical protein
MHSGLIESSYYQRKISQRRRNITVDWLIAKLGGWAVIAIVGAIFIAALNLLAKTGSLVRNGVETKKALEKARVEMAQQGMTPNEKFHGLNKSASLKIALPIAGWAIIYIVVFFAAPTTVFLFCLLLLIAPIFGYSGYKFTSG